MISFVWSSKYAFVAGSGGSETYTAGQVRELQSRGIAARIVTIGFGENDGRTDFPDIPFLALDTQEQLAELDDLIVYVIYPLAVKTKHRPYAILHCPPPNFAHDDPQYIRTAFHGVKLITASKFAAGIWRRYLKTGFGHMPTVYPFADVAFSQVERPKQTGHVPTKILYAGRLHPDKGIYTLLSSLHMEQLQNQSYQLTVTTAGSNTIEGKIILPMLQAHPSITVVPARKNAAEMAQLMAEHEVVVMPSTNMFWQELFGMVSIESQHAGCRVVASRSGGLPETNLGQVILIHPDDPQALAGGIAKAIALGPLTSQERRKACSQFTVKQSADALIKAINYHVYQIGSARGTTKRTRLPRVIEGLPQLSLPILSLAKSSLVQTSLAQLQSKRMMLSPVTQQHPQLVQRARSVSKQQAGRDGRPSQK
jgi:D-inositol-3-phosphate glycosyltransferase